MFGEFDLCRPSTLGQVRIVRKFNETAEMKMARLLILLIASLLLRSVHCEDYPRDTLVVDLMVSLVPVVVLAA